MSPTVNAGALLNLVGLSAGIALYAMLLAMVVRAGRARGSTSAVDPLLLLTSLLGLVWNLCALPVYALPRMGIERPFPYLVAIGFGALGFLPAVVVHSVLRGEGQAVRGGVRRSLVTIAYTASGLAAALHLDAAGVAAVVPASVGMRLLTYTFALLVVPLAAVTRGQPGSRRALWAAALAIFAVSALHLSQLHRNDASWPVELVGHHASLPLAFAILYQDYPFALADLFLKRALKLLAMGAIALAAIATFGLRSAAFARFVQDDPRQVSVLVTLWVAAALLYPGLGRLTSWFVDAIVLHRPDYTSLRGTIARLAHGSDDIPGLLSAVCERLAPALSAPFVTWRELTRPADDVMYGPAVLTGSEAALVAEAAGAEHPLPGLTAIAVTVQTTDSPRFVIAMGQLTGGRRLLSDDFAALEAIAVMVARRIDAIRIANERHARALRDQEMDKLATEAELRALRAQVNPHFLFNALTTIGYLIQTAPSRALETLLRLTALLRAVLRSEGEFTTLGRELEVVEAYLDIERARFEQRLGVMIEVPARLRHIRLPPLVVQPLVENAVKHGIARRPSGGQVAIRARLNRVDNGRREVAITVQDTGVGTTNELLQRGLASGVGLRNVERRLACQYGAAASLSIRTAPDEGTIVEIRMPVDLTAVETRGGRRVAS